MYYIALNINMTPDSSNWALLIMNDQKSQFAYKVHLYFILNIE